MSGVEHWMSRPSQLGPAHLGSTSSSSSSTQSGGSGNAGRLADSLAHAHISHLAHAHLAHAHLGQSHHQHLSQSHHGEQFDGRCCSAVTCFDIVSIIFSLSVLMSIKVSMYHSIHINLTCIYFVTCYILYLLHYIC